jgi:DNA topoisomerase-3
MAPIVVLNVAEKPSVARALAQVFGNIPGSRQSQSHRSGPAQIFEIENVNFPSLYQQGSGQNVPNNVRNEPHTMITTSVRGHLASQDFGPAYGWTRCPPVALFDAPINTEYSEDMQPLERMLRDLSRRASALILWLDCDREGEAISDEVRTVCIKGNPRLQSQNRIYRAKFSTVLPGEIQRALRSLGRINEHFVQAVLARSEHDLRVGAAFTRFQTLRLQKKFDVFTDGVISYGPCQFPTLGFVVERWARIETFVPEDFWTLEMSIRLNEDGSVSNSDQNNDNSNNNQQSRPIKLTWKRGRLYDRAMTAALCDACLEAGEAVVTSIAGRPKNKWRPIPLATVELQKRACKYLRIGSEELMQKAEELYQQGFISYPRTETEKFRPEFNHHTLIQSFQAVAGEFGDYANRLLSDNNFQNPRAGQNDDNAHPPITPAKAVDPQTIADPTQRKIYTLVVKHYLACCSRDAVGRETELTLRIASEEFVAKGLMILERNWLDIYHPWEKWYTGQGELPRARVGSRIVPTSLSMNAGQTSPPQLISEVELIALMDRNGIGTDATIAQHITTIIERKYAEKDGNQRFHPTKLGIALVEGYNSMGYQLNKPDLRREMESECNAVAAGRKTRDQILGPVLSKMLDCFKIANAEVHKLDEAVARHFNKLGSDSSQYRVIQANFTRCGSCNGMTVLKERSTGGGSNRGGTGDSGGNKLLQCAPCSKSFLMPRYHQEVRPGVNPNNQHEPLICPICQFQVVDCIKDDGSSYFVCPQCFSDPPEEHGGDSTDFPCTKCTHQTCSLAKGTRGGDVEIFSCPFCASSGNSSGKVCLKRGQHGYRLSCSNGGPNSCQYTIWLPKAAREIVIDDSTGNCNRCSNPNRVVRQLKFIWKPGSVPPHYDRELCACVLCDEQLKNDMDIRIPALNQVNYRRTGNSGGGRGGQSNSWGTSNNNSRGGRGNTWSSSNDSSGRPGRGRGGGGRGSGGRNSTSWGASTNGRGGGGGGGSVLCFSCGGPHYANACPNRQ